MPTRAVPLDDVRSAYGQIAQFERWVSKTLLPAIDGKVNYDSGSRPGKGLPYHLNEYAVPTVHPTKFGVRISFTIPAYNANEWAQNLGSVTLTWDQVDQYTAEPRRAT